MERGIWILKMTPQKVIMVHGWGGNNKDGWFKPLREKLEEQDFEVIAPPMPDTLHPKIETWAGKLKEVSGEINNNTYLIGHSIGCQTIMRFLEGLEEKIKVGGAIFVAGWFNLTDKTWDDKYTREIANPWIKTSIDFKKVLKHLKKTLAIFSTDDPYVPLSDSESFKKNLNAEVIIIKDRGHIEELNKNEIKMIIDFLKK